MSNLLAKKKITKYSKVLTLLKAAGARITLMLVTIVTVSACATTQSTPSCFPRTGSCIQATVNGESVEPVKSSDFLQPYKNVSHYVDQVTGYISKPISGELNVQSALTSAGVSWIGTPARQSVAVVPLEQVKLESSERVTTDPNIRINGAASVGIDNVLNSNILPTGKYLLRLTVNGSNNWDRKTIFIEVKQSN